MGVDIVRRALEEPIRQIAANAGGEGSVVVGKLREDKNANGGYNAATEEYVDMIKAGIIDPTKVSRCALQNAASVAGLMLTTEVMITELPEEKKEAVPAVRVVTTTAAWKACTKAHGSVSKPNQAVRGKY